MKLRQISIDSVDDVSALDPDIRELVVVHGRKGPDRDATVMALAQVSEQVFQCWHHCLVLLGT
jgi:hypothetical protein